MPKVIMNYQNTIIYKIVPKDVTLDFVYVGHTTNFTKRKCQHKSDCCNEKGKRFNYKVYKTIRDDIGGWKNLDMIEIEKFPCNDENEAKARERYWLELLSANLNCTIQVEQTKNTVKQTKNL